MTTTSRPDARLLGVNDRFTLGRRLHKIVSHADTWEQAAEQFAAALADPAPADPPAVDLRPGLERAVHLAASEPFPDVKDRPKGTSAEVAALMLGGALEAQKDIVAALRAELAILQPASNTDRQVEWRVLDGWKLVPENPTEMMLKAGGEAFFSVHTGEPTAPDDVYIAMLAAAPTPPAPSGGQHG